MNYSILWGPCYFSVTSNKILPVSDFSTSMSLKSDTNNDTENTDQTNVRGRELQKVTFSTTCLRAAGVDPRECIENWDSRIGNAYPMYIGGKRFGPSKMMLTNVEVTDVLMTPTGTFLKAVISLTFEEYADGSTTSLTDVNTAFRALAERDKLQHLIAIKSRPTGADKRNMKS